MDRQDADLGSTDKVLEDPNEAIILRNVVGDVVAERATVADTGGALLITDDPPRTSRPKATSAARAAIKPRLVA
jgi:hypothetical protein